MCLILIFFYLFYQRERKVQVYEMLSGVLNEIVGLLPVCIPVMITFIALRKGIAFVQSILHSA